MNGIPPASDLENNFADEAFENQQFESEVYFKLNEAEKEANLTNQRYSSKEVLKEMKEAIDIFRTAR